MKGHYGDPCHRLVCAARARDSHEGTTPSRGHHMVSSVAGLVPVICRSLANVMNVRRFGKQRKGTSRKGLPGWSDGNTVINRVLPLFTSRAQDDVPSTSIPVERCHYAEPKIDSSGRSIALHQRATVIDTNVRRSSSYRHSDLIGRLRSLLRGDETIF